MNVLIDTDILLDVALNRTPFSEYSSLVLDASEQKIFQGFIAWHTVSNFYYLFSSSSGSKKTKDFISDILKFIEVSPTSTKDVIYATELNITDFEDALQIAAAKACNAEMLITRNIKHYKKSPIPSFTPKSFLKKLN